MSARLMPGHSLATGLVGFWPMIGRLPDKVFDLSGNGSTGTVDSGSPIWQLNSMGSSLLFTNGDDGRINCGSNSAIDDLAEVTLVVWLKTTSNTVNALVPLCKFTDASFGIRIDISAGKHSVRFSRDYVTTDAFANSATTAFLFTDKLYQIVATIGIDKVPRIYVDGIEITYNTQTTGDGALVSDAEKDLYIGNNFYKSRDFDGLISLAAIYNRVLSATEIALLYRKPFCMFNWEWLPGWVATAGEIKEVSGTITATSSLSATAKRTRKVAGSIAGISSLVAAAKRDRAVSGVIAGQSDLYGSVEGAEENAVMFGVNF